jgi:hypothetical protein
LTRILAAFATQYKFLIEPQIKSIKVLASGLPVYNPVALSMAAAAGTAFSLHLLGNDDRYIDLPARSILKEEGIEVDSKNVQVARPGVPSKITLEYELGSGEKKVLTGQIDYEAETNMRYSIKGIDTFTGRGFELHPIQYILVEHDDVPGSLGAAATAIGNYHFNITRGQINFGSDIKIGRNLMVFPVVSVHEGKLKDTKVPPPLLGAIMNRLGESSIATEIDLRRYKSHYG